MFQIIIIFFVSKLFGKLINRIGQPAVVGEISRKFGGSAVAARITGQSWKDSFLIGALMNTRGLMELIVLNIGYDLGILSPQIFSIMVLMALVTTLMTCPCWTLLTIWQKKESLNKEKSYVYR